MIWQQEEEQYLIDNYSSQDIKKLCKILNKSEPAIRNKASRFNLEKCKKSWTEEEEKYLIANYHKKDTETIQKFLNRTPTSIRNKAGQLGLKKRKWTDQEENYYLSLVGEYPWNIVAEKYNFWAKKNNYPVKSIYQLRRKLRHLRVSCRLNNSASYLGVRDIQLLLGCDKNTVYSLQKIYPELKSPEGEGKDKICFHRKTIRNWLINNQNILERHQKSLDIRWLTDILVN